MSVLPSHSPSPHANPAPELAATDTIKSSSSKVLRRAVCLGVMGVAAMHAPIATAQPQSSLSTHVYSASDAGQRETLYCGRQPLTVELLGDWMAVTLNDDTRMLQLTRSASGARFEAVGDPDTVLWNKGELASVTWSGQELPTCAPRNALVLPFRAQGNEPFWQVRFDGWELELLQPGEPAVSMSAVVAERKPNSVVLQGTGAAQPLELRVSDETCVDTMTGMPHPQTAQLTYGELAATGCAGSPLRLLQGGEWVLTQVGDTQLSAPSPTLTFLDDGRLAGMASCNRMMGSYTITGENLQLSELASTQMFCSDQQMAQEQRVLRALEAIRGFQLVGSNEVIFSSDAGDVHARWQAATP